MSGPDIDAIEARSVTDPPPDPPDTLAMDRAGGDSRPAWVQGAEAQARAQEGEVMPIVVLTRESRTRDYVEGWRRMSAAEAATMSHMAVDTWQKVQALPPVPTPEQVDEMLGSHILAARCDNCGEAVDRAVQIGAEPDYESATAWVCEACLVAALEAIRGAP